MIAAGILAAAGVAWWLSRRFGLDFNDVILLATYGVALGMVGAKAVYLALNAGRIEWGRLGELDYVNALLQGGFVFYGGIPGGLLGVALAGRVHKIRVGPYLRIGTALIPLAHGFGRVGCYLAGCCFGIPYNGPLAVAYYGVIGPPPGVSLFPVQLLEATLVFALAGVLLWLCLRGWDWNRLLALYLGAYGAARFLLEYLRFDGERGRLLWFSTSQWLSLLAMGLAVGHCLRPGRRRGVE